MRVVSMLERVSLPTLSAMAAGALLLMVASLGGEFLMRRAMTQPPPFPVRLERDIPSDCRQVMLVLSPRQESVEGRLWLLERADRLRRWKTVRGPIPVTLGREGLAWGRGEHRGPPPQGFPLKVEGDGRSPAGLFRVPFAFGLAGPEEVQRFKLPYTFLTPDMRGVEDPQSRYYNQVVDASQVEPDWAPDEDLPMSRRQPLYRWGAFIAQNPECIPGAGSCILLHRWSAPGQPTAGCTGMSEEELFEVLAWLDPALEPRIVQALEGW